MYISNIYSLFFFWLFINFFKDIRLERDEQEVIFSLGFNVPSDELDQLNDWV